jgi:hypothetical protein
LRRISFLLACAVLAACGGDNSVVGPDDPACVKGQIAPGNTKAGQLGATSCTFADSIVAGGSGDYVSTYFDAYTFQATAGKAYQLIARSPGNHTDLVLSLWGDDISANGGVVLAAGDDEAGGVDGYDPMTLFIAPQSGVYSVRVSGYSAADTNTYTLTARACPVHGVITTSFSDANQKLQTSDCVWNAPEFYFGSDSSRIALYSVHLDANTARVITVVSSDFDPAFYIGGPGFDALCYTDACGGSNGATGSAGVDSVTRVFVADSTGDYTLVVGSYTYADTGTFKLIVGEAQAVVAVRQVSPELVRGSGARIRKGKVRMR